MLPSLELPGSPHPGWPPPNDPAWGLPCSPEPRPGLGEGRNRSGPVHWPFSSAIKPTESGCLTVATDIWGVKYTQVRVLLELP